MPSLGDIIGGANARFGLPAGYLGTVANIESSWNPNAPAASIVGASAVLNNGGTADMTAQQFSDMWGRKYDQKAGLPIFAATAKVGQQQATAPSGTNSSAAGNPVSVGPMIGWKEPDLATTLAVALAPPAAQDQQQSQLASLYAQQTAAQQQADQARRVALLTSARIAPTQQIA